MANCKNCGAEAPEGTGFCPRCGDEIGSGKKSPRQVEARNNPEYRLLTAITGGLSILLLGVLLYIAARDVSPLVTWSNFFAWFLVGHGALLAVKYIVSRMLPGPVHAKHSNLIGGAIIAAVGVLCLAGFGSYFWPMVFVGIGIYVISMGMLKFYSGNGHSA